MDERKVLLGCFEGEKVIAHAKGSDQCKYQRNSQVPPRYYSVQYRLKFKCVKYGKSNVKLDDTYLNPDKTDAIEETNTVRDLGILLSSNAQFNEHIDMVIKKAKKKASWIRRSFIRNDVSLECLYIAYLSI